MTKVKTHYRRKPGKGRKRKAARKGFPLRTAMFLATLSICVWKGSDAYVAHQMAANAPHVMAKNTLERCVDCVEPKPVALAKAPQGKPAAPLWDAFFSGRLQ